MAPSTCTGGTPVGSATGTGDGTYHSNASFLPSQTGNYWWYASYPSDDNNYAATSTCGTGMAETVVSAAGSAPTISTALSAGAIAPGGSAYDTAMLSGATLPTGTVTYSVYTDSGCSTAASGLQPSPAAVTVGSGGAVPNSSSVTFATAGTYYWHAAYSGDSNNAAATSACETLTVFNAHQGNGLGGFTCHRLSQHGRHHQRGRFKLVCFRVSPLPVAQHGDGDGDSDDVGNGNTGTLAGSSSVNGNGNGNGGAGGFVGTGGGGRHHHGGDR